MVCRLPEGKLYRHVSLFDKVCIPVCALVVHLNSDHLLIIYSGVDVLLYINRP